MVTFLLSMPAIFGISLMLFSAVALVQDKKLFSFAPKEARELLQPKPERFEGQHYFPEADVCESYHKYGFNLKSQIIRIIVYPFICAIIAWICTMIW